MADAPIVWLDSLVDRAFRDGVSDIHLEFIDDNPNKLLVRVRKSGDLINWPGLEGPEARAVISRIKSVSNVGSGVVRKAEDGRYLHRRGSSRIPADLDQVEYEQKAAELERMDIRLVILPLVTGEKHVMRLPSISRTPKIPELGFSKENLRKVAQLFGHANGLILFAGPVGMGKTTSMYSAIEYLGGSGKAVYSVEDPVERTLPFVDQIEVNEAAGNGFASVLRALRRSDLQVLMIGEIRDHETAFSAIQISIAGARVVSSIHANDSVGAVEAMMNLSGASPLQVMQSLRGVVSQRLVKRVHVDCAGTGCEGCMGTGVDGRLAIHEVLPITQEISEAVVRGTSRHELLALARAQGLITLREDAQRRLDAGETTQAWVSEVLGSD